MLIKDQAFTFQKEEQGKLYFQDQKGREMIIDKDLVLDYSDRAKELYLNLDTEPLKIKQSKEILNDILEDNNKN